MFKSLTTTTQAISCNCKHYWQDLWYGPTKRIHNKCGSGDSAFYRCTVCGKETKGSFSTVKAGKKGKK